MAKVEVPAARATISESANSLLITIPTRKNWFLVIFMGFWLCGWLFGEIMVSRMLALGRMPAGASMFPIAWLGMWTVGGAFAIVTCLWNLAGKELIWLSPATLMIKREVYGIGPVREYDLANVANLRVQDTVIPVYFNQLQMFGMGRIAFDYGAKTFRFAGGVDEAEAAQIVKLMKSHHNFAA
ncbi:MAG TPA: hypothetical protein VMU16_12130 [Candidatus Binataceae bacterium]|nr:hypothetical protein [Candidatus Binataceae bacterium]